jgi:hypothetical protein
MKASIEVNPWDNYPMAPQTWVPLEIVLASFLELIEQRRAIAVPDDLNSSELSPDWEAPAEWDVSPDWQENRLRNNPWVLSLEDDKVVESTLGAWERLLKTIESKIPGFSIGEPVTYQNQHIDQCGLKSPFIPKFLRKARLPNFQYVAPGLRLAHSAELSQQPFQNIDMPAQLRHGDWVRHEWQFYPFLFLRADRKMSNQEGILTATSDPRGLRQGKFWEYPLDILPEYEAGLYLNAQMLGRADGYKLLLPFSIASGRHARNSDMTQVNAVYAYNGLYQQGPNTVLPHINSHRLEPLFRNWTKMVESGYWEVDENGVTGGIGKFKEADSLENFDRYIIEKTW